MNSITLIIDNAGRKFARSLFAELRAAGLAVTMISHRGTTETVLHGIGEPDRAAAEAVVAAHVPNFGHVAKTVAAVKREAARRIEDFVPAWKQRNLTAFAVDMADKRLNGGTMTPKETDQYNAAKAIWAKVQSIRAASDAIEARVAAMTDAEAGAFDTTTAPEWPE